MSSPTLLETIRLVDGQLPLLPYHQRRVDRSRRLYYAKAPTFRLTDVLQTLDLPQSGEYKLRLLYGAELLDYTIQPYHIRPVDSLRVVRADDLKYARKYADRAAIGELYALRQDCDDVLIAQRGYVTDSSYANLAFYDGRHWYTPAWPLLRGARRQYLLDRGTIRPSVIRLRDIPQFESIRLINAMMEWERGPTFSTTHIRGL